MIYKIYTFQYEAYAFSNSLTVNSIWGVVQPP